MSELQWVHLGMGLLVVALFLYVAKAVSNRPLVANLAWTALALSCVSLAASLGVRSMTARYFALSNMYESMLVLILGIQAGFLVMDRWFRLRSLGWPVCLLLVLALNFDLSLPTDIRPLQAALQSYWRSIHVPVIILSYAMFTLAFVASAIFLVKDALAGRGGGRPALAGGPDSAVRSADDTALLEAMMARMGPDAQQPTLGRDRALDGTLDSAMLYDEITYRCVAFGFPLLAIGIILGAMWANEAWGNYWSWDPKESMSLVTLLAYGVYLHLRVSGDHGPKTLAWVSVAGFALMLVTYFGVNLMGVGLHSYGKIG